MSRSVGRNDPCPCGSGRKFKKCHLPSAGFLKDREASRVDPRSPEFQAKAFALFDAKIAAEKARKEKFGEVRPIMHTEAWGKRLIGVENQIYSMDPRATFADFLREYLREALGLAWWNQELAKPLAGRHQVAQWQVHLEELMQGETDEQGRYVVDRDGLLAALL